MQRADDLTGKPLHALAIVLVGWIAVRLFAYFPFALEAEETPSLSPLASTSRSAAPQPMQKSATRAFARTIVRPTYPVLMPALRHPPTTLSPFPSPALPAYAPTAPSTRSVSQPLSPAAPPFLQLAPGAPAAHAESLSPPEATTLPRRWSASLWLYRRNGGNSDALARAGQLGGSQAGGRIEHALPGVAGLAVYARATLALERPAAPEAALGLAWHAPTRPLPISIGVERRIALGAGGRDAMALVGVTGFGPKPVMAAFTLEAYGQAGVVGLHRRDAFADGRITLAHPLASERLSLGLSVSGGAQPGVRRLDIGPRLDLRLPLGKVTPRLSLEWRERIAGEARPGSGPALTLASDF